MNFKPSQLVENIFFRRAPWRDGHLVNLWMRRIQVSQQAEREWNCHRAQAGTKGKWFAAAAAAAIILSVLACTQCLLSCFTGKKQAISLPPSQCISMSWFSLKPRQFSSPTLDSGEVEDPAAHYILSHSSIFPPTLDYFLIQDPRLSPYPTSTHNGAALSRSVPSLLPLSLLLCQVSVFSSPGPLLPPRTPPPPAVSIHSQISYWAAPPTEPSFVKVALPRSHIQTSFSWPSSALPATFLLAQLPAVSWTSCPLYPSSSV